MRVVQTNTHTQENDSAGFAWSRGLLSLFLPLPPHHIVIRKVAAKNVQGTAYCQVYAPPAELAYLQVQATALKVNSKDHNLASTGTDSGRK